ncbi:Caspase-2 [Varanus komodoensis]|nr:Caspase-2 [Varanus komodoensis]
MESQGGVVVKSVGLGLRGSGFESPLSHGANWPNANMFGWSARSWFYNCAKPTKKESKERTHHWLADILSNHRERIVGELDVQKVLSYLVYERVFSLEEYKDILSWECCEKKAAYFLEKLACKGPGALSAFCCVLEEVCPHLLISILLDYQGVLTRNLTTSEGSENSPPRTVSEMEMHHPNEARGLEGKLFAEDQINHSFSRYRLNALNNSLQGSSVTEKIQKYELPREVVEAPSVRVFKDRLDVHMVGMS